MDANKNKIIVVTIEMLKLYIEHLQNIISKTINESITKEQMLECTKTMLTLFTFVSQQTQQTDVLCNNIYEALRKIFVALLNYESADMILRKHFLAEYIESCKRNNLLLKEEYSYLLLDHDLIQKNSKNSAKNSKVKANINVSTFKSTIYSCEFYFARLIKHDEVYYMEVDDMFKFFYFFRNEDGEWYWSPPKKEDKEDVWICSSETKITEGNWKGSKISRPFEEFLKWLYIFKPIVK